jgi:hypothetical protein
MDNMPGSVDRMTRNREELAAERSRHKNRMQTRE